MFELRVGRSFSKEILDRWAGKQSVLLDYDVTVWEVTESYAPPRGDGRSVIAERNRQIGWVIHMNILTRLDGLNSEETAIVVLVSLWSQLPGVEYWSVPGRYAQYSDILVASLNETFTVSKHDIVPLIRKYVDQA